MGGCSCVCTENPEKPMIDVKSILTHDPHQSKKNTMLDSFQSTNTFSLKSQIVLQSISRGYLSRVSVEEDLSQYKTEKEERAYILEQTQPENRFTLLTSNFEEIFETGNLKKIQQELGPVDLSNKIGDGIKTKLKQAFALPDGSFYKGEWDLYGNIHGRGHLVLPNKSHYIGYFRNGKIDLWGRFVYHNSDVYQGGIENGQKHGTGIFRTHNGGYYEGEFKYDEKDGEGRDVLPDKEEYNGHFSTGKRNGKGVLVLPNGDYYEGDFENGLIHGYGSFVSNNGNSYLGYWKNGKKHGEGNFRCKDGSYQGDFVDDFRHGFGRFVYPDGKIYDGQWKFGRQHGLGWLILDNDAMKGLWKRGNRVKWIKEY